MSKSPPCHWLLERQRNPSGCNTGRKAIDFSENKCWIPPGFRGRSIPFKILSALLYSMLFYGILFMELEGTSGKAETMLNRVFSFILFFSIVLFSGNWGGFWRYLPLLNCGYRTKKAMGLVIHLLILVVVTMTIFTIFEKMLLG